MLKTFTDTITNLLGLGLGLGFGLGYQLVESFIFTCQSAETDKSPQNDPKEILPKRQKMVLLRELAVKLFSYLPRNPSYP